MSKTIRKVSTYFRRPFLPAKMGEEFEKFSPEIKMTTPSECIYNLIIERSRLKFRQNYWELSSNLKMETFPVRIYMLVDEPCIIIDGRTENYIGAGAAMHQHTHLYLRVLSNKSYT